MKDPMMASDDLNSNSDRIQPRKPRRRRSAITGTLYNPRQEPDPDQHLLNEIPLSFPNPLPLPLNRPRRHSSRPQFPSLLSPTPTSSSSSYPHPRPTSLDKKFACDWFACQKVFSRPDHLSRHRLNHEPEKIYTCKRCPRTFVRADLLTRHIERHDKKASSAITCPSASASASAPPSPSTSLALYNSRLPIPTRPNVPPPLSHSPQLLNNLPPLPSTPSLLPNNSHPHDFHLPPFNNNSPTKPNYAPPPHSILNKPPPFAPPDPSAIPSHPTHHSLHHIMSPLPPLQPAYEQLPGTFCSYGNYAVDVPFFTGQDFQWLFDGSIDDASLHLHTQVFCPPPPPPPPHSLPISPVYDQPVQWNCLPHHPNLNNSLNTPLIHQPLDPIPIPTLPAPLPIQDNPPAPPELRIDQSTVVSVETHMRIMQVVKGSLGFLENDARFGVERMAHYLSLYWTNVQETSVPILHRPTFKTSEASVFLLCLMMCLGAYFTDSQGHELATLLYEDIRQRVISSPEFKPRASLDIIQVTLLVILYGKLCSTRNHHEMAHIFWGSTLTMYRRSALFSPRSSTVPHESKHLVEAQWKAWIQDESSKRAAYAAFLIDVQHAAIFRHAPTLSAFHIQHVLPADEEEWMAPDAIAWDRIRATRRNNATGTLFMSALKASLMPGMAPPHLNPFSRVVILHGLISVAFDLQWRDVFMTGLVASESPVKDWRSILSQAFNAWKICLDSCLRSSDRPAHQLLTAAISIYALAHIVLSIDVHELQIYAGAQETLGLTVAQQVVQSTKDRVHKWARSKDGRASTWHAAHFLRSSLQHLDRASAMLPCLHYTWACYISVLTVVAYGTALADTPTTDEKIEGIVKDEQGEEDGKISNNTSLSGALKYLDAMCTSEPEHMLNISLNGLSVVGLIEMIYQVIESSRWEIALEGAKILHGLIVKFTTTTTTTTAITKSGSAAAIAAHPPPPHHGGIRVGGSSCCG